MNFKYGLLKASALNLGDDVQSVILKEFLPQVDRYVDGCFLRDVKSSPRIKLIIHGRFDSHVRSWPPSPDIDPLFISFSMGEYALERFLAEDSIEYFKQHEPIGCRDFYTRDLLAARGVDTYFSGCVTFMTDQISSSRNAQRTGEVILTDLDAAAVPYLPAALRTQAAVIHHGRGIQWEDVSNRLYRRSPRLYWFIKKTKAHIAIGGLQQHLVRLLETDQSINSRLEEAEELLNRYARAKLVLTSRLHATLPCLGANTPVIFVHRYLKYDRLSGLRNYIRGYTVDEFKEAVKSIDFENPAPNSKSMTT